jgi:hypothetical protein
VVHGELLDEHGEFFIRRRSVGGSKQRRGQPYGGDPTAADDAEWHHGFEVPAQGRHDVT